MDDDSNSTTPCRTCYNGTFILKGSVGLCSGFNCPIGTYDHDLNAASSCRPCKHGFYQSHAGSVVCNQTSTCSQNQGETTPPTTSTDRVCSSIAFECASLSNTTQPSCLKCNAGYFINAASCTECPSGSKCVDGISATRCPVGTYQPAAGASGCFDCPLGSTKEDAAALYCSACLGGLYLPPSESAYLPCLAMTAGYYGIYGNGSLGYVQQLPCPPGSMCINGSKALCPMGFYQDQPMSTTCKVCAVGTYNGASGRSSPCAPLPPGHYSDTNRTSDLGQCLYGMYCVHGAALPCGNGTYQDDLGQTFCKPCGSGEYVSMTAEKSCDPIPNGYFGIGSTSFIYSDVASCSPGSYCMNGVATACPPGYFQNISSQSHCVPCRDQCGRGLTWMMQCDQISGASICSGKLTAASYLS